MSQSELPNDPWSVIGGLAKQDVEPITDKYFNKRKIWRSQEWRERRDGHVECEWCGKLTEEIQLHHAGSEAYNIDWYSVWDEVAYDLYEEFGDFNESMERGSELYLKHTVRFVRKNRAPVAYYFKQNVEYMAREYIEQDELVPLCKPCHYAWEDKRMRICEICGDSYGKHRSDDELPAYTCWDCVVDEKGLEECGCGGYYNPSDYDQCRDCRMGH